MRSHDILSSAGDVNVSFFVTDGTKFLAVPGYD